MQTDMGDPETQCGMGSCHPKPLQTCTHILMFTILYSFSGIFTSTNSIYLSSQITTLEKYFGFTSSQTGFLMSCNDIGFLMTTLFISYQARKMHIPRVLSIGGIVFGISGIICSFAYFMSPLANRPIPEIKQNETGDNQDQFAMNGGHLCHIDGENISLHKCLKENSSETKIGLATEFTPVAMTIFAIGLIIQGICKSPRQPFVTTYIDDNVDKTQTAFYMGLSFAMLIFGPAIGYGIGGFFSKTYVTLEDVDIGPNDPRWIGAWWLGFVVFGGSAVVSGIPLLFFPRRLKPKQDTANQNEVPHKKHTAIQGWFKAVIRLFTNPIYALCVVSVCIGAFLLAGLSTFMPKYVETQFTLPAWQANILLGIVAILAAALGGFLGGCITSKLKLSPLGCLKFVFIINVLGLLTGLLFYVLGCPNPEITGFNRSDISNRSCMSNCECDDTDYFVVCGSDGQNYFSPCHAGCTDQINKLYVNCSCINDGGSAYPGLCRTDCTMLYPYIGLMLVTGFLATISAMPFIIFIIRAVSDKDKSLAIGVSTFLQTLLGFFPGPIIVGKIVDSTCVLWTSSCSKQGACALHDNDQLRIKISTIIAVAKSAILILTVVIYWFSRHKTDWSVETDSRSHKHAETERFLDKETETKELEQMSRETSLKLKDIEHNEMKTFGSH